MKTYCPAGHIVDLGGHITGVLLQEKTGLKVETGLAVYVSWDRFLKLVAQEEVQLFSLRDGNLDIRYDNEGPEAFNGSSQLTLDEYWKSDSQFNEAGVMLEDCLNVSLFSTCEKFKMQFSVLTVWHPTCISSDVEEQIRKASLSVNVVAPNLLLVQASPELIQDCLKQLKCPVCVNVDTHTYRDNLIYPANPLLIKVVTDETILQQIEIDFLHCSHGSSMSQRSLHSQ